MGRSKKKSKSGVTWEQEMDNKKHLSHKVVYVLEFRFNDLTKEEINEISRLANNSKKPVPDLSAGVIDKLMNQETGYHIYDIRKSVLLYEKLTPMQRSGTRNVKNSFLGKDAYILETNASNNIVADMQIGQNRFFVKFYIM